MNDPTVCDAPTPIDGPPRSWWSQQGLLTRKELRETLRDRRTIVTLIAMPVLLYPLLGLLFRFVAVQQLASESPEYRIAVSSAREAEWLRRTVELGDKALGETSPAPAPSSGPSSGRPRLQFLVPADGAAFDLRRTVRDGVATLGVRVRTGANGATPPRRSPPNSAPNSATVEVELIQLSGAAAAEDAAAYLRRRLDAVNVVMLREQLQSRLPPDAEPVEIPIAARSTELSSPPGSSVLVGLLPLVLLLMTVTGGVYPAIDLTAGERERDTLETLMALPIARVRLLGAKYVAVLAVTLLTGLMNLGAMATTVYALQLETTLFGPAGLTVRLAATLFAVLTIFGLFYSAVLLALTSAARSFKEAQAYLIPLMLLSIAPGLVILLPGWKLEGAAAVLPLVNMLLLARELLEGSPAPLPAAAACISTTLYAVASLGLAAQLFGADAVAVGSRGGWNELLRRPAESTERPTVSAVFFTLAAAFPLYFIASGLLGRAAEWSPTARLAASGALTVGLFAGLPAAALFWRRVAWRSGLQAAAPRWTAWPAAVLLGLSVWPWAFELLLFLKELGLQTFDARRIADVEKLLDAWRTVPTPLVVVVVGVLPGLCEELFFRGYFAGGLRRDLGGSASVLVSAAAFGLFHVVLAGGAAPERFVPSTLMGLLLGWVAWKTGSVWPGVVIHVLHNSSLVLLASSRDALARGLLGADLADPSASHLPTSWLVASAIGAAAGAFLLGRSAGPAAVVPAATREPDEGVIEAAGAGQGGPVEPAEATGDAAQDGAPPNQ